MMNKEKKKKVLEILNYWKVVELLGQKDLPKYNKKNSKDEDKKGKIELFRNAIDINKILESDKLEYPGYPSTGNEVYYCIGNVKRNLIVDYLEKYKINDNEEPESAYQERDAIAWCSFKTDINGNYINKSFSLSPILWAISVWEKSKKQRKQIFNLDQEDYEKKVLEIDAEIQDKNILQFIDKLYEKLFDEYVKNQFPDIKEDVDVLVEYNRYVNEDVKNKDKDPSDYSDLGKSFFVNDITRLSNMIRDDKFGENSEYEKKVIDYILSGYEKSEDSVKISRTIISPNEEKEKTKIIFDRILDISKAPLGKWPAKYMPALMQQVAVNIAIQQNDETPIFSVNGPPGTGKTTLLKEIVANNIVERAKLLVDNGPNPDDLFEKHMFKCGSLKYNAYYKYAPAYYSIKNDTINNYSMLVTSCNNAAVENITVDLPKGKDILDGLKESMDEEEPIKAGLIEIQNLFSLEKSEDPEDIYFTRYANELLGMNDCWGLISAPFGKRSNLRNYCEKVLIKYLKDYYNNDIQNEHKEEFKKVRVKFLEQYQIVQDLRKDIEDIEAFFQKVSPEMANMSIEGLIEYLQSMKEKEEQLSIDYNNNIKELDTLNNSKPKGIIGRFKKDTSKINELIKEKVCEINYINDKRKELDSILNLLNKYQTKLNEYSKCENKMTPINADFMDKYTSSDIKISTKAQVINPWFTARYNREREKLFFYACKVHKEFVISSKCMKQNIINLMIAWNMFNDCNEQMKSDDKRVAMPYLLQSIFIFTPVISSTFASAQSFLGDIEEGGVLGMLIIDEAGQAQPQMALGAMFRCRKAIVVGDPKQIEPVVTAETDMIKQLFTSSVLSSYKDKKNSVQGFADYINPYGTYLGKGDDKEWVGCPLVVHRRCIDPMYTISNTLSYDGSMRQQTKEPDEEKTETFILDRSCWINVKGNENLGKKDHFVHSQGEMVIKMLERKFSNDTSDIPNLYIITPFTSVKNGMKNMIENSQLFKKDIRVENWLDNNIGTVHTFQGKGTDEVIFLLGCDKNSISAANWVNKNIVNVAATRAKYRFYMVGDVDVWSCMPVRIARECIKEILSSEEVIAMLNNR